MRLISGVVIDVAFKDTNLSSRLKDVRITELANSRQNLSADTYATIEGFDF